ncbi:MAG: hypothetical protein ACK41D_00290 [Rubricoccaceae bacterium]
MLTTPAAPSLDETVAALESGPTGMTPSAALSVIDHWRTACAGAHDADLGDVTAGLADLRALLTADRLDGRAIAETLAQLAEATARAASAAADARVAPALERLAAALGRAASALGG